MFGDLGKIPMGEDHEGKFDLSWMGEIAEPDDFPPRSDEANRAIVPADSGPMRPSVVTDADQPHYGGPEPGR